MMTTRFDLRTEYPELFDLIGCFFDEDWFDNYPDENAALRAYAASFDATSRMQALAELHRLVSGTPNDAALGEAFRALGSGYGPRGTPEPNRDFAARLTVWLEASLRQEAAQPRA